MRIASLHMSWLVSVAELTAGGASPAGSLALMRATSWRWRVGCSSSATISVSLSLWRRALRLEKLSIALFPPRSSAIKRQRDTATTRTRGPRSLGDDLDYHATAHRLPTGSL